jgi:hypothetical protein
MKIDKLARLLALTAAIAVVDLAQAQHPKLDAALSELVDALQANAQRGRTPAIPGNAPRPGSRFAGITDGSGRILVDIYLDGSVSLAQFLTRLQAAGAQVSGVNPDFRHGAISAYVAPDSIVSLTAGGGLHLMKLTLAPQRNVGVVTSQGATVMRSDLANASAYTGTGITVGVLSDSYDASPFGFTTIRAANDIVSGDLRPPKLVIDLPISPDNIDEGRAMMQIVQDVAPGADLCFATAFAGESAFAANIRALRTNPACNADVIVDDVFYFDEPFFSDGQVAQAVNDVATSTTLAGKKVAYFSSAGNQGAAGGRGSVDVGNAVFSTSPTGLGNIKLASAAGCAGFPAAGTQADVAGGWLDFGAGAFALPVTYNNAGSTLIMQWDDPFYQGAVSTDLNWFLFDGAGNCVFTFAADNLADDNGIEVVDLFGGPSGAYRIMVGRTGAGTQQARRVRMLNLQGWGGLPFQTRGSPATFGHSAAAGASSVAAYRYTAPASQQSPFIPAFENFSSPGPVTIVFDAAGKRMAVPELRKKPDMGAPDGGDTTFFYPGQDFEGNGRPNFFGTSAAAPHAAGVAALLLQKAGGPGSLTPKQVKSLLQVSAPARVLPFGAGAPSKTWNIYDGFGLIDAVNATGKIP